jgi:hypothetical protein
VLDFSVQLLLDMAFVLLTILSFAGNVQKCIMPARKMPSVTFEMF